MSTRQEGPPSSRVALSREDILSGSWNREQRASRVLRTIELRTAYMRAASRRVIRRYFLGEEKSVERRFDSDYLKGIRDSVQSADPVTIHDIERYSPYWKVLVPDDADLRAAVAHLLSRRYPLDGKQLPGIRDALCLQPDGIDGGAAADVSLKEEDPVPGSTKPLGDDDGLLRDVEANLTWIHLPSGATLFRQGDVGDALFLIISGRVRVVLTEEDGSDRVLADMGRDEVVGEIAILTGERRNATVYALRDSELVRLSRDDVARLAQRYPEVLMRLTRAVASRLQASHVGRVTRSLQTVAVVAGGGVPLAEFAASCSEELGAHGSVLHLNRATVDRMLGADALQMADRTEAARLLAWLEEQESGHQYILYEADSTWSEWTRLCTHQADRILLVADADANPAPGETEAQLPADVPTELVLLHPATRTRPTGTERWLHSRHVLAYHHVRQGNRADLARMVRRLLGRAGGLVLSGGGARATAHIGVIRCLEEMGIEVDLIGGTSMGAYIGSAYARGASFRDLLELCRLYGSRRKLLDLTLPFTSFFTTAKITRAVQAAAAGWEFEDLWRPFFCISSNLTAAEPFVHDRGPLWKAVRASLAVPTIFSPVLWNGELLVDGGLLNNFPLDVMRERSPNGIILGVSASVVRENEAGYRFGASVSGWDVLVGKTGLLREPVRTPSLFSTLLRSVELGTANRMKSGDFLQLADVVIQPQVERIGLLDFSSYQQGIEIGYRAAQEALAHAPLIEQLRR